MVNPNPKSDLLDSLRLTPSAPLAPVAGSGRAAVAGAFAPSPARRCVCRDPIATESEIGGMRTDYSMLDSRGIPIAHRCVSVWNGAGRAPHSVGAVGLAVGGVSGCKICLRADPLTNYRLPNRTLHPYMEHTMYDSMYGVVNSTSFQSYTMTARDPTSMSLLQKCAAICAAW